MAYKINIFLYNYVLYFLEEMPFCLYQTWPGRPSVYLTPPAYMCMVFNIKLGFLFVTVERHISSIINMYLKLHLELMLEGLFFGTWQHLAVLQNSKFFLVQKSSAINKSHLVAVSPTQLLLTL